jgi:hypothetical protein
MKIHVVAKFKGRDSLGFVNNKCYRIELTLLDNTISIKTKPSYILVCEYDTWNSFIKNWEFIEIEDYQGVKYNGSKMYIDAVIGLKSEYRNLKLNKILENGINN